MPIYFELVLVEENRARCGRGGGGNGRITSQNIIHYIKIYIHTYRRQGFGSIVRVKSVGKIISNCSILNPPMTYKEKEAKGRERKKSLPKRYSRRKHWESNIYAVKLAPRVGLVMQ